MQSQDSKPAGEAPSLADARQRLQNLQTQGKPATEAPAAAAAATGAPPVELKPLALPLRPVQVSAPAAQQPQQPAAKPATTQVGNLGPA